MFLQSFVAVLILTVSCPAFAQTGIQTPKRFDPVPKEDEPRLKEGLAELGKKVTALQEGDHDSRLVADVAVFAKGVEWCLRHNEFYGPRNRNGKTANVK